MCEECVLKVKTCLAEDLSGVMGTNVSYYNVLFFVFQAEDGIRASQESRGLGDVYKRQAVA